MKTITRLIMLAALVGSSTLAFGQTTINKEDVLARYEALPNNGGTPDTFFTQEEQAWLRTYLSDKNDSSTDANRGGIASVDIYGADTSNNLFGFFNTTNLAVYNTIGAEAPTGDFESSGDIDPTDTNTAYVVTLSIGDFFSLNVTTGVYTPLPTLLPPAGEQWNGIEFDVTTNILYGISSNFAGTSSLSTINTGTSTTTLVGVTGMPGAVAIAVTSSGDMYGYDVVDDNFYSINKATGSATIVGALGFDANFGQDLEWDDASGTMFMTAYNAGLGVAELRVANLGTGAASLVGEIVPGGGTQIPWAGIKNATLSVDQNSLNAFSIYPNPAENVVYLKGLAEVTSVTIFNVLGQEVHRQNSYTSQGISVQHLVSGTYMLQVVTANGTATKKLVVR